MAECINCGDFIFFSGGLCTKCYDEINGGEQDEDHGGHGAKQETREGKTSHTKGAADPGDTGKTDN